MNDTVHDAQRDNNPRHAYLAVARHLRDEQQRHQREEEYRHFKPVAQVVGGHLHRIAVVQGRRTCGQASRCGRIAYLMPATLDKQGEPTYEVATSALPYILL